MLTLNNISKVFYPATPNEKTALSQLSLEVKQGEFITVIGSNGAGKSTLFNMISGNIMSDSGQIVIDGKVVTYHPEYRRSHYVGRLFQDPLMGTAPSMTIEENLALAYLRSDSKAGVFSRITASDRSFFREKLATLGLDLENRMSSPVGLLSGGQRQALTLLMATLVTPKILLLDEHTAALDPATAEKVMGLTKSIVLEHNLTCLMITHSIEFALEVGSRTIMMNAGSIVLDIDGEKRDNMTVPKLLEAFKENAANGELSDRSLLA